MSRYQDIFMSGTPERNAEALAILVTFLQTQMDGCVPTKQRRVMNERKSRGEGETTQVQQQQRFVLGVERAKPSKEDNVKPQHPQMYCFASFPSLLQVSDHCVRQAQREHQ
jgi:hypothetical protein